MQGVGTEVCHGGGHTQPMISLGHGACLEHGDIWGHCMGGTAWCGPWCVLGAWRHDAGHGACLEHGDMMSVTRVWRHDDWGTAQSCDAWWCLLQLVMSPLFPTEQLLLQFLHGL